MLSMWHDTVNWTDKTLWPLGHGAEPSGNDPTGSLKVKMAVKITITETNSFRIVSSLADF